MSFPSDHVQLPMQTSIIISGMLITESTSNMSQPTLIEECVSDGNGFKMRKENFPF